MSRSRLYPRALSPSGSILGRARLDIPATSIAHREEPDNIEVKEVKREFKIKLPDTYSGDRAKLIL